MRPVRRPVLWSERQEKLSGSIVSRSAPLCSIFPGVKCPEDFQASTAATGRQARPACREFPPLLPDSR